MLKQGETFCTILCFTAKVWGWQTYSIGVMVTCVHIFGHIMLIHLHYLANSTIQSGLQYCFLNQKHILRLFLACLTMQVSTNGVAIHTMHLNANIYLCA